MGGGGGGVNGYKMRKKNCETKIPSLMLCSICIYSAAVALIVIKLMLCQNNIRNNAICHNQNVKDMLYVAFFDKHYFVSFYHICAVLWFSSNYTYLFNNKDGAKIKNI